MLLWPGMNQDKMAYVIGAGVDSWLINIHLHMTLILFIKTQYKKKLFTLLTILEQGYICVREWQHAETRERETELWITIP